MTQPFIGQIEIFGFSYPPYNWAFAAGQQIAIRQNTALFALIGTTYGGNGSTIFQLPNLASRQACGSGSGSGGLSPRVIGETFGSFAVSLTVDEMPAHNHVMNVYTPDGTEVVVPVPTTSAIGVVENASYSIYAAPGAATQMSPMMVQPAGGNIPHMNVQPFLGLNFCIAMAGDFPSFG